MGGLGSGGHNNKGRRVVEGQYRLDASDLKRRGLYRTGNISHIYWKGSDNAPGPSLKVIGGEDAITLAYSWKRGQEPWQQHQERVALRHHQRHFGGCETYFLCPRCACTVKRLYGASVRYLCRTCHNLVHASTQERPGNRATRKNQKLRRRVGAEIGLGDEIGPKPKGMHQKTFERISEQIHAAESEVYDDVLMMINRMQRTTERRSAQIRGRGAVKDFWR
ncbi:MAG: hypothetical protein GC196_10505 [Hyphomonas sp.]|nr:hypothetical protein [Hyphomonas sp.]